MAPAQSDDRWLESLEEVRALYQRAGGATPFGAELVELDRGRAVFRLAVTPAVGGGVAGGVHGGVMALLLDVAVVCAVRTTCERDDRMRGTAELNISYLRPATGRELRIAARVIKKGSTLAVGQVDISNDEGTLVATGRASYAMGRRTGA